jgi:peptide/nickel transport system permease protein
VWGYLLGRLLQALFTLWLAATLAFLALLLVPGDPVQTILGLEASPEAENALREQLGLNQTPLARYIHWLVQVAQGNLGNSIRYEQPVTELIGARLSVTLPLAFLSLLLATAVALPLGVLAAKQAGRTLDLLLTGLALLGLVLPSFWVGLLLIYLFAVHLGLLPSGGFPGWSSLKEALFHLLLPVVTVALGRAALLTRMIRGSLLEVLAQDYIRTARAKGLSERWVVYKHAMRNAALPIITVLGLEFAQLLTATVVVETVFGLPGLGTLVLTALEARDYPLIQGIVLVLAAFIVALNLVTDFLYVLLDPRVSYA